MRYVKKTICAIVMSAFAFSSVNFAAFAESSKTESKGLAIVHVNDVHCGYNADDNTYGYAELAAYKASLEEEGWDMLLADAGDFIQGDVMGTLSNGGYMIELMNTVGFDVATPGNHEFDYGIERLKELVDEADFPIISCNIFDKRDNSPLFENSWIDAGDGVGVLGVTVPKTLTSCNPKIFKDENGDTVYDFSGGKDGEKLFSLVQSKVDEMHAGGIEKVVLLAHLGNTYVSEPYTSYALIENTSGIDVVIDGHAHNIIDGEKIKNKNGDEVIIASTGTKMACIGTVFITNKDITSKLARKGDYTVTDDENSNEYKTYERINEKMNELEEKLGDTINEVVAKTDYELIANGEFKVSRIKETNMGDLVADAYRYELDADIGFVNGGGVRSDIPAGDITYGQIIAVQPYGNRLCKIEATGQEILDALEHGAAALPDSKGGFLQVSGLTYEINTYIPSSVVCDDSGAFLKVDGEYRVKNVKVGGEPLDTGRTYTVASHAFMLKDGGDGFSMFSDNTLLLDEVILDNQALINYISDELGGTVGAEYSDPDGNGRITIFAEAPAATDNSSHSETDAATSEKPNPDTGVEDLSVCFGVTILAVGIAVLSKRKGSVRK